MTELDRFLAGDHARHLRNIAIVIQPTMAHYADHLRAIAAELDQVVRELQEQAQSPAPDGELE